MMKDCQLHTSQKMYIAEKKRLDSVNTEHKSIYNGKALQKHGICKRMKCL